MRGAAPKKIADDDNVDGNEQQDDRRESIQERSNDAPKVIHEHKNAKDSGIPDA